MQELIEIAIQAAIEAGEAILEVYETDDFGVETKGDNSPLTKADKAAHQVIVKRLAPLRLPILSEEGEQLGYDERKSWDTFWMVDPLDGTKEFIKRNGEFTVNIALIKGNEPIGGVVYVPVSKVLYWADEQAAYKKVEGIEDAMKLPLSNTLNKENFVVIGSRSHMSAETDAFIKDLDTQGKPVEVLSKGSSLKLCLVAEGSADVYPRLAPTMEWDTAAAHAVVKGTGKNVFQYENNKPVVYNKPDLLNPWFVVK